jgi:hypothetical protein
MSARLAGRLLTSPVAFLVAGVLDFALFASATIGRSLCSLAHRMLAAAPKIAAR